MTYFCNNSTIQQTYITVNTIAASSYHKQLILYVHTSSDHKHNLHRVQDRIRGDWLEDNWKLYLLLLWLLKCAFIHIMLLWYLLKSMQWDISTYEARLQSKTMWSYMHNILCKCEQCYCKLHLLFISFHLVTCILTLCFKCFIPQ